MSILCGGPRGAPLAAPDGPLSYALPPCPSVHPRKVVTFDGDHPCPHTRDGDQVTRTAIGFYLAATYNLCIIVFSRGFSESLGEVDPLFSSSGCVGILLWGAAYFALARRYSVAPAMALVFALEKAFYGLHWLGWMSDHASELTAMMQSDPLTGLFYAIYGAGDLGFMVFFGWVVWTYRSQLGGSHPEVP